MNPAANWIAQPKVGGRSNFNTDKKETKGTDFLEIKQSPLH